MSANKLQLKRGSTAQVNAYLPSIGEPVVDLTTMSLKVGDGVTLGGVALSLVASAVKLATPRSINLTGDGTASVTFDGSSNVSTAFTLADTGVGGGTYTRVTVNSKGLVTAGQTSPLPIANGGTGSNSATTALTALGAAPTASPTFTGTPAAPTAAVGTNTTQLATTALVQAEIANKRLWTAYTPTITGSFTAISATGKYMVAFGVCHVQIVVTVTTKGTGTYPILSLPQPALSGSAGMTLIARQTGAGTNYLGFARIISSLNTIQVAGYDNSDISATGDTIFINGSYPVA